MWLENSKSPAGLAAGLEFRGTRPQFVRAKMPRNGTVFPWGCKLNSLGENASQWDCLSMRVQTQFVTRENTVLVMGLYFTAFEVHHSCRGAVPCRNLLE